MRYCKDQCFFKIVYYVIFFEINPLSEPDCGSKDQPGQPEDRGVTKVTGYNRADQKSLPRERERNSYLKIHLTISSFFISVRTFCFIIYCTAWVFFHPKRLFLPLSVVEGACRVGWLARSTVHLSGNRRPENKSCRPYRSCESNCELIAAKGRAHHSATSCALSLGTNRKI